MTPKICRLIFMLTMNLANILLLWISQSPEHRLFAERIQYTQAYEIFSEIVKYLPIYQINHTFFAITFWILTLLFGILLSWFLRHVGGRFIQWIYEKL